MKIATTSLLFFLVMIVELASAGTLLHNGAYLPSLRDNTTLTGARNVLKCLLSAWFSKQQNSGYRYCWNFYHI
ncbi:HN1_G0000430.mRNA.1.CDS.1 [Saccharomyces cerevisiae]|nr:HN1_G0000430.mRNA.1.CDS.1 [Saccharomyces cerevisiae]CAI4395084.1 BAL_1a_G0013950.mRNA.1.CDS.1 [Saccharomyces cerevisiae]CAI7097752.1 BAL_1a_G0013950.mRNA.1.CDS.1 [Saccharomyces cerevisiae]